MVPPGIGYDLGVYGSLNTTHYIQVEALHGVVHEMDAVGGVQNTSRRGEYREGRLERERPWGHMDGN